jgi:hypothetical protein
MGSIGRRIEDLERRILRTARPEPGEHLGHLKAILGELAALKSSCAMHLRGGVSVEPENIPRRVLGPGYTNEGLWRLAVERTVEAGKVPAERADAYLELMRATWTRGGKDPDAVVEWEGSYVS